MLAKWDKGVTFLTLSLLFQTPFLFSEYPPQFSSVSSQYISIHANLILSNCAWGICSSDVLYYYIIHTQDPDALF